MTTTAGQQDGRRTKPRDLRRALRLFRRFSGDPRPYWAGLALLVLEAGTSVMEPIPIAYLIDFLQGTKDSLRDLGAPTLLESARYETILLLTLAIVLIAAINSAADSLTEVSMARGGRSLGYAIRVAMYSHLQRLPLAYHDAKRTGDVLTRVTGDVLVVEDFVVKSVSNIAGSLLVLVGSFVFLLTQSWNVALVAIVVIPMLALVSNHYSRRIKVASRTQRDREGDLASTTQEMLTSIRLVQSYGRGTVDLERFSDQTAKSMRASLTAANIQARFSFVIALVEALSISAVVWLGVWLLDKEAITVGTLVLFVLLLQNMFKPARKIVSEWYKIGKVFASVERIDDLLDREIVVQDGPQARPAPPLEGRLSFRHVGFTYPAEHHDGTEAESRPPVLTDIDFDLAAGEVVALVGHSGAGKSTIAQLVPRLYDPDEGDVLVDDIPVRDLTLASLRSQISLVLQDTVLFSGTVAENIGYGIEGATQADIEEAARLANAHDFIMELPDGYATQLGERGSTLSGGQRQRLAIARAFIRHAPILILDEPTTGLDAESARTVIDALQTLMRGKTTIIISHDPGLVRSADRVLVIAAGVVVESGSHDELIQRRGAYAELFAHDRGHDRGAGDRPARVASGAAETPVRAPTGLARELNRRLPGLPRVLDQDFAARKAQSLLENGVTIDSVEPGQLWLRDDGSCSLRYSVRLSNGSGPVDVSPLLARLHPDDAAAVSYLSRRVRQLPPVRAGNPPPPWRVPLAMASDVGLALHPFPIDPDLPTLARSADPMSVQRVLGEHGVEGPWDVDTVHHARQGGCVLRYRYDGDGNGTAPRTYYGKVYANGTGRDTEVFLRALTRDEGHSPDAVARFPRPVVYSTSHRLLVTEALPGEPLLRQLLRGRSLNGSGKVSRRQQHALAAAVQASGRALRALHRRSTIAAPVRSPMAELTDLRRELEVVDAVWPEEAERIRHTVDGLAGRIVEPGDVVLSHGDFTPSQVLFDGDRLGIVDLDTLCRAEPALDIGRFLAHLRLRVAKLTGDPGTPLARELTQAFVRGYGEDETRAAAGSGGRRITYYYRTSLARSALHACRQLKDARLELTLELLGRTADHDWEVDL